jgi:hypothetical protein
LQLGGTLALHNSLEEHAIHGGCHVLLTACPFPYEFVWHTHIKLDILKMAPEVNVLHKHYHEHWNSDVPDPVFAGEHTAGKPDLSGALGHHL